MRVRVRAQDGRAEVVANDAGDRITPAVVAYRDDEQVFFFFSSFLLTYPVFDCSPIKIDR